jgi:hypothetical protein
MAKGAFGHLRGLFVCKGPLGWTGTPERGALGPLRATSALVQVASFPPVCSALKKFSARKNYITKNLRRLKTGGQTCYLHLTGEGAPDPSPLWPKDGPTSLGGKAFGLRERLAKKRRTAPLTAYPTYGGAGSPHPNRFPHTTPTSPQIFPTGKNVGKSITDWLRASYEAISPLPQHFPFFRWLKKTRRKQG